jgi:hypothetical protein
MNRRQFLAGAGAAVVGTAGGYGGIRVGDIRPYDIPLPTGDSPRERIIAAAAYRLAADHRAITRTRVLDDGTEETPYDLDVYRRRYQHSRRRYIHALTTYRGPLRSAGIDHHSGMFPHRNIWALLHYSRVFRNPENLPLTKVLYMTDGKMVSDLNAPVPEGDTVRVSDAWANVIAPHRYPTELAPTEFIRPHRTNWETSEESSQTVTYRLSDRDAYTQVVPFPYRLRDVELGECWIEVTISRNTGRLRRITDHRVHTLTESEGSERSLTYRIETEFDQYEETTVRPPVGDIDQDLTTRLKSLIVDLITY